MRNVGLDEAQAGIKAARRNITYLRYADSTTLMAESHKELKSLLMKVKEEKRNSWLKTQHSKNEDHGIRSHCFMANRKGEKNGKSDVFFSLVFKITVDSGCGLEIKRCMFLGRNLR